jgi:hypothetical protein
MASQGQSREERWLLGEIEDVEEVEEPGVNETFRAWLPGGEKAYFKPVTGLDEDYCQIFGQEDVTDSALAEVAAYRLAVAMGPPWDEMVPPVVLREVGIDRTARDADGNLVTATVMELGTLMGDAGDQSGSDYFDWEYAGDDVLEQAHRAAVFDAFLGNQDRHLGNCTIDGRIRLIDHGFSCVCPEHLGWTGVRNCVFVDSFTDWFTQLGSRLTEEESAAVRRVLESDDLGGLGGILSPEREAALRRRGERMLRDGRILSRLMITTT